MVRGKDWLGGGGVDVKSNAGIGCDRGCTIWTDYGIAYQCVELIERLIVTRHWSPKIWGDAWAIYGNASSTYFDKHPNGSGYIPVPGDIIVWHRGEGHVSVVEWVGNGSIGWLEQNDSPSGRSSAPLSASGALGNYGGLVPTGFLHAKANRTLPAPPLQGSAPNIQGSAPNIQGSAPNIQGGGGGTGGGPPSPGTKGFTIQDDYYGGTWARYDPNNGSWYSHSSRPPNGKYWFSNGLGVAVNCARSAAAYSVTINGQHQTWSWWAHVTDDTWVPTAVFSSVWSDGNPGVSGC